MLSSSPVSEVRVRILESRPLVLASSPVSKARRKTLDPSRPTPPFDDFTLDRRSCVHPLGPERRSDRSDADRRRRTTTSRESVRGRRCSRRVPSPWCATDRRLRRSLPRRLWECPTRRTRVERRWTRCAACYQISMARDTCHRCRGGRLLLRLHLRLDRGRRTVKVRQRRRRTHPARSTCSRPRQNASRKPGTERLRNLAVRAPCEVTAIELENVLVSAFVRFPPKWL